MQPGVGGQYVSILTIPYSLITICRSLVGVLFYDFQELFGVCGLILSWAGYGNCTLRTFCCRNMHKLLCSLFSSVDSSINNKSMLDGQGTMNGLCGLIIVRGPIDWKVPKWLVLLASPRPHCTVVLLLTVSKGAACGSR